MEANFSELLPLLVHHNVKFIVVGGGAAIAQLRVVDPMRNCFLFRNH
jgi:hypothetical protein